MLDIFLRATKRIKAFEDGFFAASPKSTELWEKILASLGKQAGGQVILQFPCKWFVVELEVFSLSITKTMVAERRDQHISIAPLDPAGPTGNLT